MAIEALQKSTFDWTEEREKAAALLAEDSLTDQQIADSLGIHRTTLANWKRIPTFQARVEEHIQEFRESVYKHAFARKEKRVQALNRAAEEVEAKLIAHEFQREEIKLAITGEVYSQKFIDKAGIEAFRGLLDDIAKELGERKSSDTNVNVQVTLAQLVAEVGDSAVEEFDWTSVVDSTAREIE